MLDITPLLPSLNRYARYLCKTNSTIEFDDLVQNTVCRALEKQHLFNQDTNLRAWLFTIMHSLYINYVRKHSRVTIIAGDDIVDTLPAISQTDSSLIIRDLVKSFKELTKEQQEIIIETRINGLSYDNTADTLSMPVGTVRSKLSRAVNKLKKNIEGTINSSQKQTKTLKGRGKSSRLIDLVGLTFGRLLVISREGTTGSNWNCICKCGKLCVKSGKMLVNRNTKSCGCITRGVNNNLDYEFIKANWGEMLVRDIAEHLNTSSVRIYQVARKLNLPYLYKRAA